jgi:hypothetical protein
MPNFTSALASGKSQVGVGVGVGVVFERLQSAAGWLNRGPFISVSWLLARAKCVELLDMAAGRLERRDACRRQHW